MLRAPHFNSGKILAWGVLCKACMHLRYIYDGFNIFSGEIGVSMISETISYKPCYKCKLEDLGICAKYDINHHKEVCGVSAPDNCHTVSTSKSLHSNTGSYCTIYIYGHLNYILKQKYCSDVRLDIFTPS